MIIWGVIRGGGAEFQKGVRVLELDLRVKKDTYYFGKSKERMYYVFPAPGTHPNYVNRPTKYTEEEPTKTYVGRGSNGIAKLLPEVHGPATVLMSALLDYGKKLGDYSILSAVIGNGWRKPDEPTQGEKYLDNIKMVIGKLGLTQRVKFPTSLESEAEGMLGDWGDPRFRAFREHLGSATADGWTPDLATKVLSETAQYYVPRGGFNPHATGLVFDS